MLTLYQQHHYSVCFFCQSAPQGAASETNTSPTAGIPEVEALKTKNAELEAKIAELEAKDALRNEENARLKVSAENHVCTTLVPVCLLVRTAMCAVSSLVTVVAPVRLHVDSERHYPVT